jgi:uncharacterized protein (DUF342 family)
MDVVEPKKVEGPQPSGMDLIRKAEELLGSADSKFENGEVVSVEELLRRSIATEADVTRLRKLSLLLSEFERGPRAAADPKTPEPDPVRIEEIPVEARLTLLPSKRGGRDLTYELLSQKLKDRGIVHGLREAVIHGAVLCANRAETVYRLVVASGDPGQVGEDGSVSFAVKAFDKRLLLDPDQPFFGDISSLIEDVKAGTLVARLSPSTPGRPGRDIRGMLIPSTPGKLISLGIGEGLQLQAEGRELRSLVRGTLMVGEESLDLIAFHVVDGHLGIGQDIAFDGNVVVSGHVTGPVRIQARDIFIAGNVEGVQLSASGDVWVGGSIQGKAAVEAEGRVLARSVSDSSIRAIGDVIVLESIIECRVTSSGRVTTRASSGVIEGGEISGFRGIVTHTLGSSYGLTTKVKVGVEDMRAPILAAIDRRMKEHEDSLTKIDDLKGRLAGSGLTARHLGPEQQVLYISVLRREIQSLEELRHLRRRRRKIDSREGDTSTPGITVSGSLHPPVVVEIGEISESLKEPLTGVQLGVGADRKIAVRKEEVKSRRH